MAFKPSQKRSREEENIEPNITPIMNLMVVLIPLLLSAAQLTELSLLEYLPPAEAGVSESTGSDELEDDLTQPTEKLSLVVNLAETGIQLSMFEAVEPGPHFYEIPLRPNGAYNWSVLKDSLISIKSNIVGNPIGTEMIQDERTGEMKEILKYKYKDGEEISITAVGRTPFQTIIQTMDTCKFFVMGNEQKPLFPMTLLKQFQ